MNLIKNPVVEKKQVSRTICGQLRKDYENAREKTKE